MPRLSLWREHKSNDFNFIDNTIREQFLVGGTAFLVHKYLGPEEQGVVLRFGKYIETVNQV